MLDLLRKSSLGKVLVHVLTPPLYVMLVGLNAFLDGTAGGSSLQLLPDEVGVVIVPKLALFFLIHGFVVLHVFSPLSFSPLSILHHFAEFILFRFFGR